MIGYSIIILPKVMMEYQIMAIKNNHNYCSSLGQHTIIAYRDAIAIIRVT